MLNLLLGAIPSIIDSFKNSKVGKTKVPGFNQTIGEFTTSKTNSLGTILIGYAITLLTNDPDWIDRILGNIYLLICAFSILRRDTSFRKSSDNKSVEGE